MRKTVFITGGSRGIGAEIVHQFAQYNFNVVFSYNSSTSENLVQSILRSYSNVFAVKCDVSSRESVKSAFLEVSDKFGGVDILINNAGVSSTGLFNDVTDKEYERVFGVNVKGVINCCQCAISYMINKKGGTIINISSMWGQVGASCEVIYSASKSAVIGLTKALAKELAPSGINVNCICPGIIKTDMLSNLSDDELECLRNETPLERIGTPSDIAGAVFFLASDKASFITGQVLGVNGGFVM